MTLINSLVKYYCEKEEKQACWTKMDCSKRGNS